MSLVYESLGIVVPVLLYGRKIIQIFSKQELGWDETVSGEVAKEWSGSGKECNGSPSYQLWNT